MTLASYKHPSHDRAARNLCRSSKPCRIISSAVDLRRSRASRATEGDAQLGARIPVGVGVGAAGRDSRTYASTDGSTGCMVRDSRGCDARIAVRRASAARSGSTHFPVAVLPSAHRCCASVAAVDARVITRANITAPSRHRSEDVSARDDPTSGHSARINESTIMVMSHP